jgi:hypothetical protein
MSFESPDSSSPSQEFSWLIVQHMIRHGNHVLRGQLRRMYNKYICWPGAYFVHPLLLAIPLQGPITTVYLPIVSQKSLKTVLEKDLRGEF